MKLVKFEKRDKVGLITIDRERALNALNAEVMEHLNDVLDEVMKADVWAVVLTGAGTKAFVAGADISMMKEFTQEEAKAFVRRGNEVLRKLETLPIPVIAAINGFALGGGCELALSCDIRLASETALFAQPETGLGIPPGFGGTQRLMRVIGMGMAKEMIYAGTRIKALRAKELGLVNEVYPQEQLMEEAMKLAEKIAQNAPIAVRACKKAMNEGRETDIETGINIEIELFASCFDTQDQKNAMTAFVEKKERQAFANR